MRFGMVLLIVVCLPIAAIADPVPNEMVLVAHGTFIMGDGSAYCGTDEREVTLTRDFYLGQHEVTNQEYLEAVKWAYDHGYVTATISSVQDNLDGSTKLLLDLDESECEIQFDGAGGFSLRESPSGYAQSAYPGGYDPSEHPVKRVTWYGSVRYCDWLSLQAGLPRAYEHSGDWACNGGDPYGAEGYRLPTDAEWEYAAQFDDERIYPWGDEDPSCRRANIRDWYYSGGAYCVGWTTQVGIYPVAPANLGLSDMVGNVKELCNDRWVCNLGTDPVIDPSGPSGGGTRVQRGGSWQEGDWIACASRANNIAPEIGGFDCGFRVARTAPSQSIVGDSLDRSQLHLSINHPNPFTRSAQITYSVPSGSSATLAIYDAAGRLIRTLASDPQGGEHTVSWSGTNNAGDPVEAGAYFYRLTVGTESVSRRMLLVR